MIALLRLAKRKQPTKRLNKAAESTKGGIDIFGMGSREEIQTFADTLSSEKRYMDAYKKYGLDAPATYRSKFQLNKAVKDFERKTNLIWPFR